MGSNTQLNPAENEISSGANLSNPSYNLKIKPLSKKNANDKSLK